MQAALKDLEDTVVPYIEEYRQAWFNVFNPLFQSLREFEEKMMAAKNEGEAK